MAKFLNPAEIIKQLDLKPDMIVAEFGCGARGFIIELAKKLNDGLVYGIDIQKEPLSALKSLANLQKLTNIHLICSDLEQERGSTLGDSTLDMVLIPNVLFQVEDKNAIIKEAKRVLKKEGKLVIIDWLPEASQGPVEGRVSPKEVQNLAEKNGFEKTKELEVGDYHFGLVFKKP